MLSVRDIAMQIQAFQPLPIGGEVFVFHKPDLQPSRNGSVATTLSALRLMSVIGR